MEESVRSIFSDIRHQLLQKVVEDWASRPEIYSSQLRSIARNQIEKIVPNPNLYNKAEFFAIKLNYMHFMLFLKTLCLKNTLYANFLNFQIFIQ